MIGIDSVVSFLVCAFIVFIVIKLVFKGTKTAVGFLINIVIGAVALWILDLVGLGIPITWLTAGIVGLLGIPGVVIVFVLKYVFYLI